jgi:propionate CoA-transferase
VAFLSFAEVDAEGNVNVSRYGDSVNGPGGFINISQGARKVVFSGTLTTGGAKVRPDGSLGIVLEREGSVDKFVPEVQQVTFSGAYARERGQEVLFVTDRAVFALDADGLVLTEYAPGISVREDILDRIGFPVQVAADARPMDPRLFGEAPMGLMADFLARVPPVRTTPDHPRRTTA